MSYRDDRDADRARIAALEAELSHARDRIAELEGKRSQALVIAGGNAIGPVDKPRTRSARWLGAPLRLHMSRTFDRTLATDHFEELIERIRELTGDPGRTELLRSSLTWWSSSRARGDGPSLSVTVTARNNTTVLTVTDNLGAIAGGLFGGGGGGVGFGGLGAMIPAAIAVPVLAPIFIGGWLGGAYVGLRAMFRRIARKRAEKLQRLFEALAADIAAKL
jgi:hypothetical protein